MLIIILLIPIPTYYEVIFINEIQIVVDKINLRHKYNNDNATAIGMPGMIIEVNIKFILSVPILQWTTVDYFKAMDDIIIIIQSVNK